MSSSDPVVIVAAKRTAIGSFLGGLSSVPASALGAATIKALLEETKVNAADIDEVILGQVLTAGVGQNPARQAAMEAGIPAEKTAYTLNQVCGSGLRSIVNGMLTIANGDAEIVIAGGQENMSLSPHAQHLRDGVKFGDMSFSDTMIKDGLWDVFNDYHMGITAENIAEKFSISREDQDEFATSSQQKVEKATADGKFDAEIVPYTIKGRKGDTVVDKDEFPRAGVTAESLSGLRPAFKRDGGTVTAANASGINDGAAVVMLMKESEAKKRGLPVFAKIASWANAGVDPAIMGTGPIPASNKALEKAGWSVSDLDLIESNEAFAAQACAVVKELGLPVDKTNVNGGAIALGHPIGASGTRILVTLLHEMARSVASKGLATLCIGGGMGIALCVERSSELDLKTVK